MILTVTTTMISGKTGHNIWFILEVGFETMEDLYDALVEQGMITGDRIDTIRQGARTIEREREGIILGANIVGTIRPCHIEFEASQNPTYKGRV